MSEVAGPATAGREVFRATLSKIKLVVFDLDGTLVDAFEDITDAANYIRQLNGLPDLVVDDVKQHVGYGAHRLIEGILPGASAEAVEENHRRLVQFRVDRPAIEWQRLHEK